MARGQRNFYGTWSRPSGTRSNGSSKLGGLLASSHGYFFDRRKGTRLDERAWCRLYARANGLRHDFDRQAHGRRDDNRRCEQAATYPFLARFRCAVAARKGPAQPVLLGLAFCHFRECLPGTESHSIILTADHTDM